MKSGMDQTKIVRSLMKVIANITRATATADRPDAMPSLAARLRSSSGLVAVVLSSGLLLTFQNCQRPYDLKVAPYQEQTGSSSSVLVINDGATMTNDPNLKLKLSMRYQQEMYITLDANCESGGTWEPYAAEKIYAVAGADELKTIYVKFRNSRESETTCVSGSILVDTHAPVVSLPETPASISKASDASFSLAATDAVSGVAQLECRFNTDEFNPCPSSVKKTSFADGNQVFQVRAIDQAGNISEPLEFRWLVDSQAPTLTFTDKPNPFTSQTTANLAFTGVDDGSQVGATKCQIDGGAVQDCVSPVSYPALTDGAHSFKAIISDKAGNLIEKAISWQIDSVAPTLTIATTPPQYSRVDDMQFLFSGVDNAGTGTGLENFLCQLDAGAPTLCISPHSLNDIPDGPHTFSISAVDRATNKNTQARSFFIDDTPPVITVVSAPGAILRSSTARFNLTTADPNGTNGSGIARLSCRIDRPAFELCSNTENFFGLDDGSHAVTFQLTDRAGNLTQRTFNFTVDTSP